MSTKIDIIQETYSQLRISGLTVQPSPESVQAALNRLESMMAELEGRAICLGYNFEEVPDPNSNTDVDHTFNQMMVTNLAVRLIPDFNKQVPLELKGQAKQSMSVAAGYSARINLNQTAYPNRQPIGGANTLRYNWWRRFYREDKPVKTDCSNQKMFVGDVNDYSEDYHTYLSGDSLQSFTIDGSNGLTVSNSVINGERIDYRVEAVKSDTNQRVLISITTGNGRVTTRVINFTIQSLDRVLI